MTSDSQTRFWLALLRAPGIGPAHGGALLDRFGTPQAVFEAGAGAWRAAGVPEALRDSLRSPDWPGVDADLAWLDGDARRHLVPRDDSRYPDLLREVRYAPLALFCHGDPALLGRPQLAVVGSRSATPQGVEAAGDFAAELARHGLVITSGLALGIDGAAHRGALAAGGATVAVCGTGLDRVYPSRHRELAHEIAARGLLVSEFPSGTPPVAENFPRRNRIISGLSLGVLVVEAAARSGSLITARLALEQGREVFAMPGSIHSPLSRGGHALLRQGAKLTESVRDILEELPPLMNNDPALAPVATPEAQASAAPDLEPMQQRVLEALGFDATSFDVLVERLSLPVENLSSALLALELQGHIAAVPGGAYVRLRGG